VAAPASARLQLYRAIKTPRVFDRNELARLLSAVDKNRIELLARAMADYIKVSLPASVQSKSSLADYRTNPYVLITSAAAIDLSDPEDLASFLVHNKLYMGLETSFGKSLESICVGAYPIGSPKGSRWAPPAEKLEEAKGLEGLTAEQKARVRSESAWREVDKSCVIGDTRYLVSIKSGPQTINDTQVEAMRSAIAGNYRNWMRDTRRNHKDVKRLDVVIGLTYGTNKTTNNKENQILVKLLESGFEFEDPDKCPGVLIDGATRSIRVYRRIGIDFWALIGRPNKPAAAEHTFLEILLALSKALNDLDAKKGVEEAVGKKIDELVAALSRMKPTKGSLPDWLIKDYSEVEISWLMGAMSAFYDGGI
jgi:hypothetical protein